LIAQVRALQRRRVVPAIAVTGKGYEPARALPAGFHEYLTKPVDPDRLCDVVDRLASLIRPASSSHAPPRPNSSRTPAAMSAEAGSVQTHPHAMFPATPH